MADTRQTKENIKYRLRTNPPATKSPNNLPTKPFRQLLCSQRCPAPRATGCFQAQEGASRQGWRDIKGEAKAPRRVEDKTRATSTRIITDKPPSVLSNNRVSGVVVTNRGTSYGFYQAIELAHLHRGLHYTAPAGETLPKSTGTTLEKALTPPPTPLPTPTPSAGHETLVKSTGPTPEEKASSLPPTPPPAPVKGPGKRRGRPPKVAGNLLPDTNASNTKETAKKRKAPDTGKSDPKPTTKKRKVAAPAESAPAESCRRSSRKNGEAPEEEGVLMEGRDVDTYFYPLGSNQLPSHLSWDDPFEHVFRRLLKPMYD
ncbi:hypothetical protein DFH06DRAFT_1292294 [Mycena polygramma]|nr:hypothetical protein DFH06DRAFT_1292294 [Mycena polygramma]